MSSTLIRVSALGLGLAVLAIGTWAFWTDGGASPDAPPAARITQEATRGTEDDPNARRNYEQRRLRDPVTGQIPQNVRKKNLAFAEGMPRRLRKSGAGSWRPRGPVNVGGRSRALEVDVRDTSSQTVLAGGVSGGMWRTTDGGTTWSRTFNSDQRPNVTALDQDTRPGRRDVWFAGTGELIGNSPSGGGASYKGNGLYKSVDGGQNWTLLSGTTGSVPEFDRFFDYVWAVEVDPSAPTDGSKGADSEVYAATYGRIQRSVDGGATWTPVLRSDPDGTGNFAAGTDVVAAGGVTYAALSSGGDRSGLFMSPTGDPGSWTNITPSSWPSFVGRAVLAVNPANEDEVWALANGNGSGPNGHLLWKYNRTTDTWTDFTDFLPDRGGATGTFNSQGGYDLIAEVHPDDGRILFVGGRNLWRIDTSALPADANTWIGGYTASNDGFGFYAPPGSDPHHPDQHALAFEPGTGDVMYVGSDGGIHRTDDNRAGGAGEAGDGEVLWADLNNGYFTTQFYAVCQFQSPTTPSQQRFIAGGLQDNGTWGTASEDVSDPWTNQIGADGGDCSLTNDARDDSTSRYLSTQNGRVFRLIFDDGDFQDFVEVTPSSASGQLFINPFALDPSAADVMYYPAGGNLWRNNDLEANPQSWTEMTGGEVPRETITALGVSDEPAAHVLYYGTSEGTLLRLEEAHSTSPETSPTDVTGTAFPDGGYVSSIAVDPTNSEEVMVAFSNYGVTSLFYSADGGTSWMTVEGNLGAERGFSPSVRSAAILPGAKNDTYYVGTSIGIYSATALDGESTHWSQEGTSEIGNVVVDQVNARLERSRVIAGTHANGTYDLELSQVGPVAVDDEFSTSEGQTLSVAAPGVLENDTETDGNGLTASLVSDASEGALTLDGDGAFEYTPSVGFSGTDEFIYEASNGSATDTATVQLQVEGTVTLEVPIAEDWNLLSVPLAVDDPGFGAVLPVCESGYFFESGSGYAEIGSGEAVPVGRGLFANCSAGTAEITGQVPSSPTVTVAEGWNVVGPVADSVDVDSIRSDPSGIVTASFFRFTPDGGYAEASTLAPGVGYWVKVGEDGTLDFSGDGSGAGGLDSTAFPSQATAMKAAELRLTDAAGRTATLRLARNVSEKQLQRSTLPPVPPARAFDVRFESGRSVVEATGDEVHPIETQGLKAPVTIELAAAPERQGAKLRQGGRTTRLTAETPTVELSSTDGLAVGVERRPEEFALEKTYPNPASGQATVQYALPEQTEVVISVYDVLGRRVATLLEGSKRAGQHQAQLDADRMPSGTYFVRMQAGDFRQTRRVTVVR